MDLLKVIRERRSIRKFRPDEVSNKIIKEIIEDALWSPSWGNTQPWELYIVAGEILRKLKDLNRELFLNGEIQKTDLIMPEAFPERLKKRYVDLGKRVLTSLSIAREDKEGRKEYYADMYYLFDAPALILFCLDSSLNIEYAMLDLGIIMQSICLLSYERGLGTCIISVSVRYAHILHELIAIPQDKKIAMGVALGYPDWDSPVNQFERSRGKLEEFVTWPS